MEDTLWGVHPWRAVHSSCVLILILLEDTLWLFLLCPNLKAMSVLILILLEDTLWYKTKSTKKFINPSLNPYSTGRYSLIRQENYDRVALTLGLNPYSTGRYSLIIFIMSKFESHVGLNPYSTGRYSLISNNIFKSFKEDLS